MPNAVAALKSGALKTAIEAEWAELKPASFVETGFEVVQPSQTFKCGGVTIGFDASTSGISTLKGPSGTSWAGPTQQLAQPWYQNLDVDYFHEFDRLYNSRDSTNFMKPGLNLTALNSTATLIKLQRKAGAASTQFKLSMTMPHNDVHTLRGAPALLEALVEVPHAKDAAGTVEIAYTLQWFNKTSCHAPETIWLLNKPAVKNKSGWTVDKLGSMINPLDADLSVGAGSASKTCNPSGTTCGVHLHAVDSGAFYSSESEGKLALKSLDSMLVSVGDPLPAPTPLIAPDPLGGVHFSLVDNTWSEYLSDTSSSSGPHPSKRSSRLASCLLMVCQTLFDLALNFICRRHELPRVVPFHRAGDGDDVPRRAGR